MALQEKLDRFKQQQEKCQSMLSNIAAKSASSRSTPKPAPAAASPFPSARPSAPVKFSNDTERLQHINSIRKAPVGAQMKRVIDILFQTRQAFTPEQINEACYVDVNGNKDVFEGLRKNPKVNYDGKRFSYKAKHDVKNKNELLVLIRKYIEGIAVIDLRDAYPNVMEDLQLVRLGGKALLTPKANCFPLLLRLKSAFRTPNAMENGGLGLKAAGQIWLLSNFDSQEDIAFPNDPRVPIKVDDDLKELFRSIELPRDMLDIEKDLQKNGMKPATNTAKRRAAAQVQGITSKPKPRQKNKEFSKKAKLTNAHLPELFQSLKNS
ncbi:hypothetical protein GOBAR_AA31141 [Gossypium barbadense]|uniref:TFIIE beta domain-containing protein n=1 Tax=Gossypium barbadense TaxID=3634 RepID=A0A2P5WEM8_GOSBA|nr:hypothetical protein GOBAR_DD01116 [Gossypium barbadense]PPR89543.1 hypothetical protein GOBAR_AA31141 [Gossypium barbadense]